MNTITLSADGTSYVSPTTAVHHDDLQMSPLIIGVCAAGAGVFLIVIMTVLCLFAQRRRDRHTKLKLKLASTTSSSSCNTSDIERSPTQQNNNNNNRRLRNGKTISQPFDPRKGEMLIESLPPAAFFDTGSRVTSFISTPPPAAPALAASQSQSSLSPSSTTTRRQSSNRRHRLQPPIASSANVGIPATTIATAQLPKRQPSRTATVSSFVPSFVSPSTTTHTGGADWQTGAAAPSSDLNHTPSFYQVQSPTSSDSIPIRLDLVHNNSYNSYNNNNTSSSSLSMVGISSGRSHGTLHATHTPHTYTHGEGQEGQSFPSSPVTARRPEEKVADLVAALERNEAVSVVVNKRPVPPPF